MKTSKFSILLLTAVIVTSCSTSITTPNTDIKSVNPSVNKTSNVALVKLSKSDIAKLDKEYMSFSTKSLSAAYFQKKLVQLIGGDNGVANAVKIVQELQYGKYKTESVIPFQAMSAADPVFYTTLTGVAAVIAQRMVDSPFDVFIGNGNPVSAPLATAATSITSTGFTANWNTVASATSGYVLIVKQGSTVVSTTNVSGQSTTSQAITGLEASTAYTYTIQANSGTGLSAVSNSISISTIPVFTVTTIAGTGGYNASSGYADGN